MSEIDDKILDALNSEDREVLESYGKQPGMFGLIAESFRGKMAPMVIIAMLFILFFFALVIYSGFQFFPEQDIDSKLEWMAIGLASLIVLGLLRLWYVMELYRLSVIREVKRLELQVSLLAKKLDA